MDKNLLNRYFEKQCSEAEVKAVEEWLLDSNNQTEFERFLETKWQSYSDSYVRPNVVPMHRFRPQHWWKIAAAAVVCIGVYFYALHSTSSEEEDQLAISQPAQVEKEHKSEMLYPTDTLQFSTNPRNTIHHEKKPVKRNLPQIVAKTDTTRQETKPMSVAPSKLGNFKINEVLLAKLRDKIDSNQLYLNIDVHEITFQRLAGLLRQEYGIILEPCNDAGLTKTYSARFEKISFPDLLSDMSEKMLFTYSFQDSIVKICFN